MTQLVLEPLFSEKLLEITQPVELCDANGRVLGRYTPNLDLAEFGPLEPQVSDEELDHRDAEDGGRSLAEILADLERRPPR